MPLRKEEELHWKTKGIIQKCISLTPSGTKLNTRLQRLCGGMRNFDDNVAAKVSDWALSMEYLADADFSVRGKRLLEIGTGWHPALPFCFILSGAGSVATFDIVRLLEEKTVFELLDCLQNHSATIAGSAQEAPETIRARIADLRRSGSLGELFKKSHIDYFAPADGRATGIESNSIDLVYSNSVLEHVPKESIRALMEEGFRVLKPGGLAMHNVGCNDHYAFFDKSISFVNFLQYNEQEWRFWNNSLQYQNRLRAPEFLKLAAGAGLQLVKKRTNVRPGTLEALSSLQIAPEFQRFSESDLAATTIDFVSCKPATKEQPLT